MRFDVRNVNVSVTGRFGTFLVPWQNRLRAAAAADAFYLSPGERGGPWAREFTESPPVKTAARCRRFFHALALDPSPTTRTAGNPSATPRRSTAEQSVTIIDDDARQRDGYKVYNSDRPSVTIVAKPFTYFIFDIMACQNMSDWVKQPHGGHCPPSCPIIVVTLRSRFPPVHNNGNIDDRRACTLNRLTVRRR